MPHKRGVKEILNENAKLRAQVEQMRAYARTGVKQYNTLYATWEQTKKDLEAALSEVRRLEGIVNNIETNTDHD